MTDDLKNQSRVCPFCHEEIKAQAIKCRYCQSALVPLDQKPSPQTIIHNTTQEKSSGSYMVNPQEDSHSKRTGHGITAIILSVFVFITSFAGFDEGIDDFEDMHDFFVGLLTLCVLTIAYAVWNYRDFNTNKTLPMFAIGITVLSIIIFLISLSVQFL